MRGDFKRVTDGTVSRTAMMVATADTSAGVILEPAITLDTAAYAAGDTLFDFTAITGALSAAGRVSLLQSIAASDKADTGVTITLVFADASGTFGVANSVPSISDADSFKVLGTVAIAAADWVDLGGNRVASLKNIGLMLEAASGTSVYVAGLITSGGTAGTFAASDLQLRFGILQG